MTKFDELVSRRDTQRTAEFKRDGNLIIYTAEIPTATARSIRHNAEDIFGNPNIIFESGTPEQYIINQIVCECPTNYKTDRRQTFHVSSATAYNEKLGAWVLNKLRAGDLADTTYIWIETDDNDGIVEYYLVDSDGCHHRIFENSEVVIYETHYCENSDLTFITKQRYDTQGVSNMAVISFYCGQPNETATRLYIEDPSTTAEF